MKNVKQQHKVGKAVIAVPAVAVQDNVIGLGPEDLLVSITERDRRARHPSLIQGVRTIQTRFDDVLNEVRLGGDLALWPVTLLEATDILRYVKENVRHVRRVVVHCYAGVSRSPAVAMVLAQVFDLAPGLEGLRMKHEFYNRAVYKTMAEAAIKMGLMESDELTDDRERGEALRR
jgi:predicted protein tyrosine phosphatase